MANKKKSREEKGKQRLASQRRRNLEQRQLIAKQRRTEKADRKAQGSVRDDDDNIPMPGRNEPCPLHPDQKFKSCIHGCMAMIRRNRMRQMKVTQVVRVHADDNRVGMQGRETDAGVGALQDLTNAMGVR